MTSTNRPDFFRHLVGLRVVRRFQERDLSEEDITAILEAGRWTGSARNDQAWSFVVMGDPDERARIAQAGRAGGTLSRSRWTVVLVRLPGGNDFDIGRVAQNMMLAAAARGIGSCPATLRNQEVAVEVLGLPDGHVARWAIAFGYLDVGQEAALRAEKRAAGRSGRKSLDVLVHGGRFNA